MMEVRLGKRIEAFEPGGKAQQTTTSPGLVGEDEAAAALQNLTNIVEEGAKKTKEVFCFNAN